MNKSTIFHTQVSGDDLAPIAQAIEAVTERFPAEHVAVTHIAMFIVTQHPHISPEQLSQAILETSKFVCMLEIPDLDEDEDERPTTIN